MNPDHRRSSKFLLIPKQFPNLQEPDTTRELLSSSRTPFQQEANFLRKRIRSKKTTIINRPLSLRQLVADKKEKGRSFKSVVGSEIGTFSIKRNLVNINNISNNGYDINGDNNHFNFSTKKDGKNFSKKEIGDYKEVREDVSYTSSSVFTLEQKEKVGKEVSVEEERKKWVIIEKPDVLFSKQHSISRNLHFQNLMIFLMDLFLATFKWFFLFFTNLKYERNFCYSRQNQINGCSLAEISKYHQSQINIVIYNKTWDFSDNFDDELYAINEFYKPFFIRHDHFLSKNEIFTKMQIDSDHNEFINFAVIITGYEQWNPFLKFYSALNYIKYHQILIISMFVGAFIGCFVLGYLTDIYGRKLIIQFCFIIITIGLTFIVIFSSILTKTERKLISNFSKIHTISTEKSYTYPQILLTVYVQTTVNELFGRFFILLLTGVVLISTVILPLKQALLILLLENSLSENDILVAFSNFKFVTRGLAPFIAVVLIQITNNFMILMSVCWLISLVFTIFVFLFLSESVRFRFEFCQWHQFSKAVFHLLKNIDKKCMIKEEDLHLQHQSEGLRILGEEEFHPDLHVGFQRSNFGSITENMEKNEKFSMIKRIKGEIRTAKKMIVRGEEFVLKQKTIVRNPLIIYACLLSNKIFINNNVLSFISIFLADFFLAVLCRENTKRPFYTTSDLKIDSGHNIIINSNFFILAIILFISNKFYYILIRINCFKFVITTTLLLLSFLSLLYHLLTATHIFTPINLNQYNFSMLTQFNRDNLNKGVNALIFLMHFFLNGVISFLQIMDIKLTKTLYRGISFSYEASMRLVTFALVEFVVMEVGSSFVYVSMFNLLAILSIFFLEKAKSNKIIADFKQRLWKFGEKKEDEEEKVKYE